MTRSVSMRSTSVSASAENCPAYTWFAPTIAAAQGWPHAFAWNIGTTGRTVSRSVSPMHAAWFTPMACSTIERCEYSTPLGSPVVPLV